MSDEKAVAKVEPLNPEVRAKMLSNETSIFFNPAKFEHAFRVARLFASSDLVPKNFQGREANCIIAINYAERVGLDPFMTMQNMYVVHGRPGIEAKFVIALINQSGKYSEPLKFRFDGEGENYGCTAYTRESRSNEVVEGPKVTWKMVRAEGWDKDKKSKDSDYVQKSKWNTMPDIMFRYRAASYFANVNCPELKLGMQTADELQETIDLEPSANGTYDMAAATKEKMEALKERLAEPAAAVPPVDTEQGEPDSGKPKRTYTRKPKPETQPGTEHAEAGPPQDPEAAEIADLQARIAGMEKLLVDQAVINTKINPDAEWTIDGCLAVIEEVSRLRRVTERR